MPAVEAHRAILVYTKRGAAVLRLIAMGCAVACVSGTCVAAQLFSPARLEIVPKTDIKNVVRAPFAYDGAGDDAGLTLSDPRVPGLVFSLDHFSG